LGKQRGREGRDKRHGDMGHGDMDKGHGVEDCEEGKHKEVCRLMRMCFSTSPSVLPWFIVSSQSLRSLALNAPNDKPSQNQVTWLSESKQPEGRVDVPEGEEDR